MTTSDPTMSRPTIEGTIEEIRAHGGRVTPARRAVLSAILDTGGHHFTAAEIFTAVEQTTPQPDRATVYRTLELLTEIGLLTPIQLDGDAAVYHRTDHHHGHLVCTTCGAIVEMPAATLTTMRHTVSGQTGFTIDVERFALSGTCARCADTVSGPSNASPHADT
jgi:Fur family ferric uptake transcriptional regulator